MVHTQLLFPLQRLQHEIIPERGNMRKRMHHHIQIIILLDIIQPHKPGHIFPATQIPPDFILLIQLRHLLFRVRRVHDVLYIREGFTVNFIALGEDVGAGGGHVDEDVVVFVEGVEVGVGVWTAALEVFPADEAGIDVDVGEGDGAEFFKVEVEEEAFVELQLVFVFFTEGGM